jgi:hypothetical protein
LDRRWRDKNYSFHLLIRTSRAVVFIFDVLTFAVPRTCAPFNRFSRPVHRGLARFTEYGIEVFRAVAAKARFVPHLTNS